MPAALLAQVLHFTRVPRVSPAHNLRTLGVPQAYHANRSRVPHVDFVKLPLDGTVGGKFVI